jgi:hypothetical protein
MLNVLVAATVCNFATDSKAKESHDLAKSRGRRKKTQLSEQSPAEALESVLEGIATVNPFWHVTYFKFDSPEDAVRFWKVVCASPLWQNYSDAKMQLCQGNPARKVLMSLGYTDATWGWKRTRKRSLMEDTASADEAEWMKLLEWKWDMHMTLRNCYWFCNRSMQVNTKKLLDHLFAELVAPGQTQANDPAICARLDAFSLVDDQNITSLHKDTLRFETESVVRTGVREHDDDPFIVLTETKFSFRCIPVWISTLLAGLGSKKKTHVIMFSP